MKVFVIIVTYNAMRKQWITRCLDSLLRSSCPVIPIVVDNGSSDGTRDFVPVHYPNVVWLPQEKNMGFGQGNNVGIKYALDHDADYVLLLNQDASLHPDAIKYMLEVSDGESLVSPIHLNGSGDRIDEMFRCSLNLADNTMNDDMLIRGTLAERYEMSRISAACWLLPVHLLKKIGGFNPLFFHYGEDSNYSHRLAFHGVRTWVSTRSFMYHDRNLHGDPKAFLHKKLYRDLLLVACDINRSLFRRIAGWGRELVFCYMYDLPKRQYIPGTYCWEMCRLLVRSLSIMKSRKVEKRLGCHWL